MIDLCFDTGVVLKLVVIGAFVSTDKRQIKAAAACGLKTINLEH